MITGVLSSPGVALAALSVVLSTTAGLVAGNAASGLVAGNAASGLVVAGNAASGLAAGNAASGLAADNAASGLAADNAATKESLERISGLGMWRLPLLAPDPRSRLDLLLVAKYP